MADSIIIGGVFVTMILLFTIVMLIVILYMYLEQKRKEKRELREQETQKPNEMPDHVKQRYFDKHIKDFLSNGIIQETDKTYRQLRKRLLDEVAHELNEHRRGKHEQMDE